VSTSLNVRSSAGLGGALVSKLAPGSYVTLIYKSGNWWYVEYAEGLYGYVSTDYIRFVYGSTRSRVDLVRQLNMRSGPASLRRR
jgi:uncharacterized protein YgiM (DUF1202 family)